MNLHNFPTKIPQNNIQITDYCNVEKFGVGVLFFILFFQQKKKKISQLFSIYPIVIVVYNRGSNNQERMKKNEMKIQQQK